MSDLRRVCLAPQWYNWDRAVYIGLLRKEIESFRWGGPIVVCGLALPCTLHPRWNQRGPLGCTLEVYVCLLRLVSSVGGSGASQLFGG